eukprot:CAMPEP_0116138084 /NCGR_PEP_ID=MMETSP0329-20121206/12588_1 /TAXON_ID=697910 /ORGANISM="Pseudo-nitzschia arenysensis, Strain B593" /LENGTH=395 /DNA_ID=CAMNT_0003633033 /DNA_START=34 /DNA_END=1216 /DNA_ORIENTATION=-
MIFDFPIQAALSSATVVAVAAKSSERDRVLTKAKDINASIDNSRNSASPFAPDKLGTLYDPTAYSIDNKGVRQPLLRNTGFGEEAAENTIKNVARTTRTRTAAASRNGEFDASKELGILANGSHEIKKNSQGESSHRELLDCEMGRPLVEADVDFRELIDNCVLYGRCPDGVSELQCWDTSQVTDMSHALNLGLQWKNISFNEPIGSWDTSAVTDMTEMFWWAEAFNQDISSWDVSAVKNMHRMFHTASSFNQELKSWNVSAVTNMIYMFGQAHSFNQELDSWDVSGISSMSHVFAKARAFNQSIGSWDTSAVTDMTEMFWWAEAFNQDISSWDVSAVKNMHRMFHTASSFNQELKSWNVSEENGDVSKVTRVNGMFSDAFSFDQDVPKLKAIWR